MPPTETDTYLVMDDFAQHGRSWVETDEHHTDRETVLCHLMEGQFHDPVRIVGFNTSEGWSRDVSEDIADELRQRCALRGEIPEYLASFIDRYSAPSAIQLVLPMLQGGLWR
jgi:hypothetical protein